MILQVWNDAAFAIRNAAAACSLLSVVHPDPEVIGLAEQIELEVQAFRTDLFLDADVFAQLRSVDGQRIGQPLDAGAQRMLDEALRDFRRAGVDRDEETRDRVRALDQRLTDLGQAFDRNIRDGRRTTLVPAAALDGLPEDFVAGAPARTRTGWSRSPPSTPTCIPFLTFARDAAARRAGRAQLLQPRLAGQRRRPRGAARDPAREGHPARLRRAGPTTTPRPR